MVTAFAGLTGVLNRVFGASVTHRPQSGPDVVIRSVFREEPVQYLGTDGGEILDLRPVWRVPEPAAANIRRGDLCLPGNGATYRVVNRLPNGEPTADRFVIFELESVP